MFKKTFYFLVAFALFFNGAISPLYAEVIRSFDTEVEIAADSTFRITETILYDFEEAERHGIFRFIPTEHPQAASNWYKDRYLEVEVEAVLMDNEELPFQVHSSFSQTEIKIGDEDQVISGPHTYTITYVVRGGLYYEDGVTEFYWNAIGNEWEVPITEASVSVFAAEGILGDSYTCYVGSEGSKNKCTYATSTKGILFTTTNLKPGVGMTIAYALNPDAVAEVILERFDLLWPLIMFSLLFISAFMYVAYRIATKHKLDRPVIAQYEPYQGVLPMHAGMLADGTLHAHDITAGIIYLAEQGFLKIKKINKKLLWFETSDYEITLIKDGTKVPGKFLPQILKLFYSEKLEAGNSVTLSEIKKNLPKQTLNQKILSELRKQLREDLKNEGYIENTFVYRPSWPVFFFILFLGAVIGGLLAFFLGMTPLAVYAGLLVIVFITASIIWTRQTQKGYEAQNHLHGFKLFLSVTDKDRFDFHNAPAKNSETFMRYLPYAIAFGVEEKWAEVFADITIPAPSWYDTGNTGVFPAMVFAKDLSTFSSSLSASSGATPAAGGGSVGGGAGGGGGGSW